MSLSVAYEHKTCAVMKIFLLRYINITEIELKFCERKSNCLEFN